MDPRLNSGLMPKPQAAVPSTAHQATPSAAPPPSQPSHSSQPLPQPIPPANSVSQPMTPQLVASFPVKQPVGGAASNQPAVPASQAPQDSAPAAAKEDDLDKILQAVNNRVKTPDKAPDSKKKFFGKKILSKTAKVKDKAKNPKPLGPAVAALVVLFMLISTAIFAYKEGNHTAIAAKEAGKVGTSYTASNAIQDAGGALVHPADLNDYAQTLQTKINSLNNSQDFASGSLSDQTLGL